MAAKQRDLANGSGRVTSDAGAIGVRLMVGPGTPGPCWNGVSWSSRRKRASQDRLQPGAARRGGSAVEAGRCRQPRRARRHRALAAAADHRLPADPGQLLVARHRSCRRTALLLLLLFPFLAWRWLQGEAGGPERRRHPDAAQHRLARAGADGEPRARLAAAVHHPVRGDLRRLSRRPHADPQHRRLPAVLRAADLGLRLPAALRGGRDADRQEPDPAALRAPSSPSRRGSRTSGCAWA